MDPRSGGVYGSARPRKRWRTPDPNAAIAGEKSSLYKIPTADNARGSHVNHEVEWAVKLENSIQKRVKRKLWYAMEWFRAADEEYAQRLELLKLRGYRSGEVERLAGPKPIHPLAADSPFRHFLLSREQQKPEKQQPLTQRADYLHRRRLPRTHSALLACLQCKMKQLVCSLERSGQNKAARCVRCVRNGCAVCIQQAETIEQMVEHEGCRPGEEVGNYIRQRNEAPIRPDGVVRTRLSSAEGEVVLFVREPGVPAEELLEMAADLVHSWTCSYGGILGEPLTAHELRALALPDWHINVSSSPRDVDEASEPGRTPKSWRAYFAEGHGWHEKNRRLMAEGAKMCEGDESSLEHAYQDLEEAMKRVCGDVPQSSLAFDEEDAEERPKREERGDSSASSSLEVPNRA